MRYSQQSILFRVISCTIIPFLLATLALSAICVFEKGGRQFYSVSPIVNSNQSHSENPIQRQSNHSEEDQHCKFLEYLPLSKTIELPSFYLNIFLFISSGALLVLSGGSKLFPLPFLKRVFIPISFSLFAQKTALLN